jgi:hypothetical protein
MAAYCLLLGSPTIGWYSGIVALDVVRGEGVLDKLMLNIMHVQTFVEECTCRPILIHVFQRTEAPP